eukprot:9633106-Karenia_brevis.AAC.1
MVCPTLPSQLVAGLLPMSWSEWVENRGPQGKLLLRIIMCLPKRPDDVVLEGAICEPEKTRPIGGQDARS